MDDVLWKNDVDPACQLRDLVTRTTEPGVIVVRFGGGPSSGCLSWRDLEPWTRSRAVTASVIHGDVAAPGLDVALLCDLVFVHAESAIMLGGLDQRPSAAMVWALARAGRAALARGLLDDGRVTAEEAVRLGLAHEIVAFPDHLPLPIPSSLAALTAARDLMRSRATGESGRALELATFRLLFASGDPEEGARAFLERRQPDFPASDD